MARVFVRGIESTKYGLEEIRQQRRSAPRVIKVQDLDWGRAEGTRNQWLLGPGDEPFRSQTLNVHNLTLEPGGVNQGHGHQNEALFYVLEGRGYEIHDDQRHDWAAGDVVMVHNDCVHRHYNADPDQGASFLVIKAKPTYLFMGLWQQGAIGPRLDPAELQSGEWIPAHTARDLSKAKVVKVTDTAWQDTPLGRVRPLVNASLNVRCYSVDAYLQELAGGGNSARHWHMADEVGYVLEGSGYDLHWDVEAEIREQYYWRVASTPTRHEWTKGDLIYIPPNTVHQHFSAPGQSARLLFGQNRIFQALGHDRVEILEPAAAVAGT